MTADVKCVIYESVVQAIISDNYGVTCKDFWAKAKEGEAILLAQESGLSTDSCDAGDYVKDYCPRDCTETTVTFPQIEVLITGAPKVCPIMTIT